MLKNIQIKIFEKLLKTRNDTQTRSILNIKGGNSLPKLMSREPKSQINENGESESEKHIFQINRFSDGQNMKVTEMIKRFIPPSERQSVAHSRHPSA